MQFTLCICTKVYYVLVNTFIFQEWYEHKLKLLKQDKRRRGETIGKVFEVFEASH